MNHLEKQVTELLGLTKTGNVLDAIEYVKTLNNLLKTTEHQRKSWAELCIKKQARIEELEAQVKSSTPLQHTCPKCGTVPVMCRYCGEAINS